MRLMLVGDVVGKPGLQITVRCIRGLKRREGVDVVVVNAENAADGSGLTPPMFKSLMDAGVDCVTLGDHIYRRREIFEVLEKDTRVVKPCNYPDEAPGRRWTVVHTASGAPVGVFSALGRVFMKPVDCPFRAADQALEEMPSEAKVRIMDFHAEATSDMQLMGRYLDGRVTAVLGTHTHVPTADECIFPGGTAFQSDACIGSMIRVRRPITHPIALSMPFARRVPPTSFSGRLHQAKKQSWAKK